MRATCLLLVLEAVEVTGLLPLALNMAPMFSIAPSGSTDMHVRGWWR